MEREYEIQQVMGPDVTRAGAMAMLPRFKYDGGCPSRFLRDFPLVSKFFGVEDVFRWDVDQRLDEEGEKRNTVGVTVLRQYVSEDVLSVISVGQPQ